MKTKNDQNTQTYTKKEKAKFQKWLDKSVAGLAKQNFRQSVDDTMCCLYRGPSGLKCALGHLMKDSEVREGYGPGYAEFTIQGRVPKGNEVFFLDNLQRAHDRSWWPSSMKFNILKVAKKFDLKAPACLRKP